MESAPVEAVMVIAGAGEVRWGSGGQTLGVRAGDTLLLPEALPVAEFAADDEMEMLEITFPEPPEEMP